MPSHADTAHTYEVLAGMKRRRDTAYRLPPMECCRCRDPWTCKCHDGPQSVRQLDAYAEAAEYLLALDLLPAPNVPAMHRMWRGGGSGLRLAARIAECWGLAA